MLGRLTNRTYQCKKQLSWLRNQHPKPQNHVQVKQDTNCVRCRVYHWLWQVYATGHHLRYETSSLKQSRGKLPVQQGQLCNVQIVAYPQDDIE